MAFGFASWVLFLHLLLLALHAEASGANVIKLNTMDDNEHRDHHMNHNHGHGHGHHHLSSSSEVDLDDPQLMAFFMIQDLKPGQIMPIYFPNRHISPSHLLPKHKADTIPFSLAEFPNLLHMFSFAPDSPQAIAMESTLKDCESKPNKGETKTCATSLESVHEFATQTFGPNMQIKTLTTTHLKDSTTTTGVLQNYKVVEILQNIPSPKLIACHTLPYPYAIFYCHGQESENKVFMVSLEGENGDLVEALSVCHMETSQWSPGHAVMIAFGIQPGTSSICHFFPSDNFVLIPVPATI